MAHSTLCQSNLSKTNEPASSSLAGCPAALAFLGHYCGLRFITLTGLSPGCYAPPTCRGGHPSPPNPITFGRQGAGSLEGQVDEVHLIGDALAPRRLMDAILDGARAGRNV